MTTLPLPNFSADLGRVVSTFGDTYTLDSKVIDCAVSPPFDSDDVMDVGVFEELDIEVVVLASTITTAGGNPPNVGNYIVVNSARQNIVNRECFIDRKRFANGFYVYTGKLGK